MEPVTKVMADFLDLWADFVLVYTIPPLAEGVEQCLQRKIHILCTSPSKLAVFLIHG